MPRLNAYGSRLDPGVNLIDNDTMQPVDGQGKVWLH